MKALRCIFLAMLFACLLITSCTQEAEPESIITNTKTKTLTVTPVPTRTLPLSPADVSPKATATQIPKVLPNTIKPITIPACEEGGTHEDQNFEELLQVISQNFSDLDSYRYRTLYRYTMGDNYADDELSVEVVGIHQDRLDTPFQNNYYPMSSQNYERTHITLTDLSTQSSIEAIITEQGYWVRHGEQWIAFDSATPAGMLNLADMFSPQSMFSDGYQGGFVPWVFEAGAPTNVEAGTIDGQEVTHRCWLFPDFGEEGNAVLYHYEDFYTYLGIAEMHLWTAENDTQLVRLVMTGNHTGERMGYGADAVIQDPPQDFLLWIEQSDLVSPIDITPPDLDEISMSITSDLEPVVTVTSSYNELPLPDDVIATGDFDAKAWYSEIPREYSLPVWEGQFWMLSERLGGGWDEIPMDRRPTYETKMDLSEAIAFYLDEMGHRGWHLKDNYLIFGLTELYIFFERNGVVLPVILRPETSGNTLISAFLPPPDNDVDDVLSGWVSFQTQNYYEYDEGIMAIAFDAQGRTWIGTRAGLKVYDGEAWTTYNAIDLDLPVEELDFEVRALAVDQQGKVWVGTLEGLSVFDGQVWKTYTTENSELESNPYAITIDSAGKVWLGHGYDSSVSVFDGKTFRKYNENEIGMPGGHAVDVITTDQDGHIWIGTSGGGIYMFDGTSWNVVVDAKTSAGHTDIMISIEDLAIDHQGRVWGGSGQGLGLFDGENWTIFTTENSDLPDDWVNSLEVDPQDNIWVITTGGRLSRIDTNGKWSDYTPLNPDIPIHSPETLAIDPQGRIWVGMDYGGISVFAPPNTTLITKAPPIPTPTPTPIPPTPTPRPPYKTRGGECLGVAEDAVVDLDCREITIAVENANLPFNYVLNETNEPSGWDYDAWDEICTRLHCTPIYVETPWDGMIEAVADGQYDVAANGVAFLEERGEIVDFSEGYISIERRLLVRVDETRITEIEDIINDDSLKLGAITRNTYQTAYQYLGNHEIQGFETFYTAVQALISGEIDALIVNNIAGLDYVGEDKTGLVHLEEDADKVKLVGRTLLARWYGFMYPKGSDLVEPVNLVLQSMMADSFLDDLNTKYFGPEFNITYDDIGPGAYGE